MKMLLLALLCALTYAQTASNNLFDLIQGLPNRRPYLARGSSFIDAFQDGGKIWRVARDRVDCNNGPQSSQCTYLDFENVGFYVDKVATRAQLDFRDNCVGFQCCQSGICTPFTAGRLSSIQSYGHGAYIWQALAIHDRSKISGTVNELEDTAGVLSCFMLQSTNVLKAGLCVSTKNPHEAITFLQVGIHSLFEYAPLAFDASKSVANYRIEYKPCCVRFLANGEVLRHIGAHEIDIPMTEVRIGMGLFPDTVVKNPRFSKLEDRSNIWVSMHVFRVRYWQREKPPILHDEPFVVKESSSSSLLFFFAIFILTTFIITSRIVMYRSAGNTVDSENPYVLITSADCSQKMSADVNYRHSRHIFPISDL